MATRGTQILNPRTGQRSVFLQTAQDTGGALFQMETFHPAHNAAEPEHTHPFQESRCQVLTGTLRFRVGGVERTIKPGEAIVIPPGVAHHFWNDGEVEAHAIQEFRPALNIEDFFVAYFALARDGKLSEGGIPKSVLQLAVLLKAYDRVLRPTNPPRFLQRVLMETLGPIGRLAGYQPNYI
ncbi:MAG: cupin domain-containing protein [Meiothermus sp.]|uniref:cupin domain-containing protein n=1 Tax=Allomeiothermus silvanus TaxID=52022 RepID=UPI0023F2C4DA|nr:cupin domain-containing protein [Allomeiothermus silvanus]MCX7601246.1 cupin domain-containing protein [Meiothermus sp.]